MCCFFRGVFVIVWILAIVLAVFFMVIRLVKNPTEETQHNQGFNTLKHNPALVSNLQILFVVTIFIVVGTPALFVADQGGPDSFVLATLPSLVAGYLVVPICFYVFNRKLRKYIGKEIREALGLNFQEVQPESIARF